jgi:hypothetical protein
MWATSAIMSLHLRLALFALAHMLAELVAHFTGIRNEAAACKRVRQEDAALIIGLTAEARAIYPLAGLPSPPHDQILVHL